MAVFYVFYASYFADNDYIYLKQQWHNMCEHEWIFYFDSSDKIDYITTASLTEWNIKPPCKIKVISTSYRDVFVKCIGYSWSLKWDCLVWNWLKTTSSVHFSSSFLSGNDGRVPYRRLCTMAQVPLNLWKFLPETNIARNSNLGWVLQPYWGGAIILSIIMEIV